VKQMRSALFSSGIFRSVEWQIRNYVSSQLSIPSSRVLDCLNLEDGIKRYVGTELTFYAEQNPRKAQVSLGWYLQIGSRNLQFITHYSPITLQLHAISKQPGLLKASVNKQKIIQGQGQGREGDVS
jgi:hypothetical protein